MNDIPITTPSATAPTSSPVLVYTDGACSGNPGPGGCAGVLLLPSGVHEFSLYEPKTTNNRMEIRAIVEALNLLDPSSVEVHTDSRYVIDAATKWIKSWKRKGWRRADGSEVRNPDLWKKLLAAMKRHTSVTWRHVRGHSNDLYNDRADALARQAARGEERRYGPAGGIGSGRSSNFSAVRF